MATASSCTAMYAAFFAFQAGRAAMCSGFRVAPSGRSRIIDMPVSSRGPCIESARSA